MIKDRKEELDIVKFIAIRRSTNYQAHYLVKSCVLAGVESMIINSDGSFNIQFQ